MQRVTPPIKKNPRVIPEKPPQPERKFQVLSGHVECKEGEAFFEFMAPSPTMVQKALIHVEEDVELEVVVSVAVTVEKTTNISTTTFTVKQGDNQLEVGNTILPSGGRVSLVTNCNATLWYSFLYAVM